MPVFAPLVEARAGDEAGDVGPELRADHDELVVVVVNGHGVDGGDQIDHGHDRRRRRRAVVNDHVDVGRQGDAGERP